MSFSMAGQILVFYVDLLLHIGIINLKMWILQACVNKDVEVGRFASVGMTRHNHYNLHLREENVSQASHVYTHMNLHMCTYHMHVHMKRKKKIRARYP